MALIVGGLLVGAAIPLAFGISSMQTEAALPESERNACGMAGLAALLGMVIGLPCLSFIGALVGLGLFRLTLKIGSFEQFLRTTFLRLMPTLTADRSTTMRINVVYLHVIDVKFDSFGASYMLL